MRYFSLLLLALLTTTCTVFLEENTRVVTTARVVDGQGQPLAGISVAAFTYTEAAPTRQDEPLAQVGNAITKADGTVQLTSFYLNRGVMALVFSTQSVIPNEISYVVSNGVYDNRLAFYLGDVVVKELANVTVNFVNTSMPTTDVPFQITYESGSCTQFVNAQGAVDLTNSSCYAQEQLPGVLAALSSRSSFSFLTNLGTQVTVAYSLNGTTPTETFTVTSQDMVYEINY